MSQKDVETESDVEMESKEQQDQDVVIRELNLDDLNSEMHCELPDQVSSAWLPKKDSKLKTRPPESNKAFFFLESLPDFRDVTTVKAALWLSKIRGVVKHSDRVASTAGLLHLATALLAPNVDSKTRGSIYQTLLNIAQECRHRQSLFEAGIMGKLAIVALDLIESSPGKDIKDLNGFLHILTTLLVPDKGSYLTPGRLWSTTKDRNYVLVSLQDIIKKLGHSSNKLHVFTISYLNDLLGWLQKTMVELGELSALEESKVKPAEKKGCLDRLLSKSNNKISSIDELREAAAKAGFELAVVGESDKVSAELEEIRAKQDEHQIALDSQRNEIAMAFDRAELAEKAEALALSERDELDKVKRSLEADIDKLSSLNKHLEQDVLVASNWQKYYSDAAIEISDKLAALEDQHAKLSLENGSLKRQLEDYAEKATQRPAKRARVSQALEPTRRSVRKRVPTKRH